MEKEKKNAPSLKRIRELISVMTEFKLDLMEIDGMRFVKSRYPNQPAAEAPGKAPLPKPPPKKVDPETVLQEAQNHLYTLTHLMNGNGN